MDQQKQQYRVSYDYVNPCAAGPYRGRMVLDYKPQKGDTIRALFGSATVRTVSKVK